MENCPLKPKEKRRDAGVVVIPFDGVVQAGASEFAFPGRSASRVALAKRCAAEPGPYRAPKCVRVPALRSSVKNAAARPGHVPHVSTSPVLEPLAAESLRP